MPQVLPFKGLRPSAERAAALISPPYDVLNRHEARDSLGTGTRQFLRVSRPEACLPDSVNSTDTIVYRQGAENLRDFINSGQLIQDQADSFYVYRISEGDQVQTGLVATVLCEDYECNRIRRHEHTRPGREADRRDHMLALRAQTGPVLVTHRSSRALEEQLAAICSQAPEYFELELEGVRHSLWRVVDPQQQERISALFVGLDHLYIADGHHRSAAACCGSGRDEAGDQRFLAVMFPCDQLRILDYNRVVQDLNGLGGDEFLSRLATQLDIRYVSSPYQPAARGQFGMYLDGSWYALSVRAESLVGLGTVDRLDVSLLAALVLEPVLGINDARLDPRIDFIGGSRGLQALEDSVNSGDMRVAFSLFPTTIEDVMAVADRAHIMPPKSTWFHPKLADGLVTFLLDG